MAITSARMQIKRGEEINFDPDKVLVGEFTLSVDEKIIRIGVAPGVSIRLATYDAFEADVAKIQSILEEVQTIEEAVVRINTEVSENADAVVEYTALAKQYRDEAKQYAEEAKTYAEQALSTTPDGYNQMVSDVDLLKNSIVQTSDRTLYGSKAGGIKLIGIKGASEQGENPSPDNPQEIESVGDSGSLTIKAEGKNKLDLSKIVNGYYNNGYNTNGTWRIAVVHVKPNSTIMLSGFDNTAGAYSAYLNSADYTDFNSNAWNTNVNNGEHLIPSNVEWIGVCYYQSNDGAELQIEEGTVATAYEPYRSKSITIPLSEPLRKGDEIAVVDGVWGVLHGKGKEVVDGNTKLYTHSTTNGKYRYSIPSLVGKVVTASSNNVIEDILCTHYTAVTGANTWNEVQGVAVSADGRVFIYDNDFNTSDTSLYKAQLAENPIAIEYPLATKTFEPFADQTPFYGLESFDTMTYISTDSEIEPTVILKFAKTEGDAVTLLNYNQTNLNRIAIAELTSAVLALNQE